MPNEHLAASILRASGGERTGLGAGTVISAVRGTSEQVSRFNAIIDLVMLPSEQQIPVDRHMVPEWHEQEATQDL